MSDPGTAAPSAAQDQARADRARALLTSWARRSTVGSVAVLTWALLLVIGVLSVRRLGVNPLTAHGVVLPLAIGIPLGMIMFGLAARIRSTWLIGVAVGTYAAWAGTTIAAAVVGTPYGFGFIAGDAGRMSALAMHFSTTWHPGDAADPSLPAEYPPLYPMIVGRVAALTGRPAWMLLQPAQIVITSFAVVAGFLLWRRLIDDVPAFLASTAIFVSMVEPSKGNEILSLSIYLPWLLGTFAAFRRRRSGDAGDAGDVDDDNENNAERARPRPLHPVASGILIGLIVPWSPQVLFLSLLGVILVAGHTWWTAPVDERRPLLIRWGTTILVSLVVASWFIFPLAKAYLTGKVEVVADLWIGSPLVNEPFTILSPRPLVIALLQIIGLLGIVGQLRRTWWSAPVALYLAGVLIERAIMLLRYTSSAHAFMLYYVAASLSYALNVAGILTLAQVWRWARPYLAARSVSVRLVGVTLSAVLVATCGYSAWVSWAPTPRGVLDYPSDPNAAYSNSMRAHADRLPNGHKVRYPAPRGLAAFPSDQVAAFVHKTLGRKVEPNVISDNQAIYAFNAWRDWIMPDRVAASGLTRWDYRHGLLTSLARTTDPATMAESLRTLEFGPVDVLILRVKDSTWSFGKVHFDPAAFAGPQFHVSPQLRNWVVITRTG